VCLDGRTVSICLVQLICNAYRLSIVGTHSVTVIFHSFVCAQPRKRLTELGNHLLAVLVCSIIALSYLVVCTLQLVHG